MANPSNTPLDAESALHRAKLEADSRRHNIRVAFRAVRVIVFSCCMAASAYFALQLSKTNNAFDFGTLATAVLATSLFGAVVTTAASLRSETLAKFCGFGTVLITLFVVYMLNGT